MAEEAIVAAKREYPGMTQESERNAREAIVGKRGMGLACHPFPNGAWAIEAKTLHVVPDYGSASGEVAAVVYVGDRRVEIAETTNAGEAGMFIRVASAIASDYDKDGVPEFWMRTAEDGVEGGHSEDGRLLHFDGRAVVPYVPASKLGLIGAPRDVDGDGLMDLPASLGITLGQGAECFGKSDWSAAKLLAHALPDGTFSTNDAVAKSFTSSSWCASAPSKVTTPEQAFCARMWNRPRTLVSSACTPWDCRLEVGGKPQPKNATRDCQDRLEAYDAAVPFTLP